MKLWYAINGKKKLTLETLSCKKSALQSRKCVNKCRK